MSTSPATIPTTHMNNFRLMFSRAPHVEFFARRVTMPSIMLGAATQFSPMVNIPQPGEKLSFDEMEIEFALDVNWNGYAEILNWMLGLGRMPDPSAYRVVKDTGITSNITIAATSNHKNLVRTINVFNAWPTGISPVTFDTEIQDPSEIKVTATFALDYYTLSELKV